MAEERDDIEVVEEKDGNKTKLLIIVISSLMLAVIAIIGIMLVGGGDDAEQDENIENVENVKKAAIYYSVDDPFIVNFSEQSDEAVRYMQVKMKVMAREQAVIDAFTIHLPAIQHELLMLFYSQNYDELQTSEGTKALQQQSLETINRVLKSETSLENELEAVYFTSFIMQ
ncbi:flagellar basal body-associated FliL family protein [Methylophaga sp.]|uniref:flagellar basal body-associated FliL family protein n=1 Tax=Methylophaga sp. TaxID=2024840 RepID=UPI003F6A5201